MPEATLGPGTSNTSGSIRWVIDHDFNTPKTDDGLYFAIAPPLIDFPVGSLVALVEREEGLRLDGVVVRSGWHGFLHVRPTSDIWRFKEPDRDG